jgi:hypothetical protein
VHMERAAQLGISGWWVIVKTRIWLLHGSLRPYVSATMIKSLTNGRPTSPVSDQGPS